MDYDLASCMMIIVGDVRCKYEAHTHTYIRADSYEQTHVQRAESHASGFACKNVDSLDRDE